LWVISESAAGDFVSGGDVVEQTKYVRYGAMRGRECRRSVVVWRWSGKSSSGRRRSADRALRGDCERHEHNDIMYIKYSTSSSSLARMPVHVTPHNPCRQPLPTARGSFFFFFSSSSLYRAPEPNESVILWATAHPPPTMPDGKLTK